jgi:hypothetical protein
VSEQEDASEPLAAKQVVGPLTPEQARLVRENIGLVGVHLRRNVHNLAVPRRDREWEDLFQEGCLGLIQAAVRYRRESGIAFAAYALPRIHNAVSRALISKFSTVYLPPKRRSTGRKGKRLSETGEGPRRPSVRSLTDEAQQQLAGQRCHDPDTSDRETIGERLRGKYERAARAAGEVIARKTSTRGDRDKLVQLLMEERVLVPHEESRAALRLIARRTNSSYARVAQCDRQLHSVIRDLLEADPEFGELRRRARTCPDGVKRPIDGELERDLAFSGADEFLRRFHRASAADKAQMLATLLEMAEGDIEEVIHGHVARLTMHQREVLSRELKSPDACRTCPPVEKV